MTSSIDPKTTGALSSKTKRLIAVTTAHVTRCPLQHHRPHESSATGRSHAARTHGNSFGRSRNKTRRSFRTFRTDIACSRTAIVQRVSALDRAEDNLLRLHI
jgi:hypothetical protein